MIERRHLDVYNFVIEECSHLANGCTTKCGCIGLMLFRYLSCLGAIICDIHTRRFVFCFFCMHSLGRFGCKLCNRSSGLRGQKWTSLVKRLSVVSQSYTSMLIAAASCIHRQACFTSYERTFITNISYYRVGIAFVVTTYLCCFSY